jgi:hypothetical protein
MKIEDMKIPEFSKSQEWLHSEVTKKSTFLNRSTNPLMPTYTIRDEDGKLCEIGPVWGNQPSRLPSVPKDKNRTSLKTKEI